MTGVEMPLSFCVCMCYNEFDKLEVSLGIYMIAFKYGLAKKWFGNPQLTYCKVLFGGM